MKKQVTRLFVFLLFVTAGSIAPQNAHAQTSSNQEQLENIKKEYQEGKITLEEYQKQTNAILQFNAPVFSTVPPGHHFIKGGRCLVAGSVLLLAGGTVAGLSTTVMPDLGDDAMLISGIAGGVVGFVGLVLDIVGGSQFIKAGKKLNALKIGQQTSYIQIAPASTGVGLAMNF